MITDATALVEQLISGEDLVQMGDLGPCELVAGRIVPMTPPGDEHGAIEANICAELVNFVRAHNLGKVRVGETGIYTSRNPDTVRGADVLFISHERYAKRTKRAFLDVAPELVVEILSPGNTVMEMNQKLREYFAIGVILVWVIDPQARSVFAYRALTTVREYRADELLPGDEVLPGFTVHVATLFED